MLFCLFSPTVIDSKTLQEKGLVMCFMDNNDKTKQNKTAPVSQSVGLPETSDREIGIGCKGEVESLMERRQEERKGF